MNNPFAKPLSQTAWLVPLSAMMVAVGFLIPLAWVTPEVRSSRIATADPDLAQRMSVGAIDLNEFEKVQSEVAKLREENTRLQNAIAKQSDQGRVLNQSLQESKMLAGLTEVIGSGITLTLKDNDKPIDAPPEALIVHDVDVLRVVNELFAAGAEAIAVNGHRVVSGTSFRCVGPVILVDSVPIASPVVIKAIGDPETLVGAMNLRGGVLEEIRQSGGADMVTMTVEKSQKLPAFAGSTTFRYAKPSKDAK